MTRRAKHRSGVSNVAPAIVPAWPVAAERRADVHAPFSRRTVPSVPSVAFYFGLGSRYSYLAFTQIARIEQAIGCCFTLHPISSIELLAMREVSPFKGAAVSGQYEWSYRRRDAEQWAELYGVPFREPAPLPVDHRMMARACRAAELQSGLRAYCEAMFHAVFVEHARIDQSLCTKLATKLGLDQRRFARDMDSRLVEERLTQSCEEAYRRGAFGVPTFFIGDELFWGNDRLPLLEHRLVSGKRTGRPANRKKAAATARKNEEKT